MNTFEYLRKEIGDHIAEISYSICRGSAKDYPEYRKLVGEIEGLERALVLVEDTERKMDFAS